MTTPTLEELALPSMLACPVYEPGRPVEAVARELGLDPARLVKLASNENPRGCSPAAREAFRNAAGALAEYPDGGAYLLREALSRHLDLPPDCIGVGNGSNDILEQVAQVFLGPQANAVFGEYGFIVYRLATLHARAEPRAVPMPGFLADLDAMRDAVDDETRVLFLASPNNPTGPAVPAGDLLAFARDLPESLVFLFDEAYAEYLDQPPDFRPLVREGRKILCTRTFSKIHGLAGLRVGYAYGPPELIRLLNRARAPFNVNAAGQAAAVAALGDTEFVRGCRDENRRERERFRVEAARLGLPTIASDANFVTFEHPRAAELNDRLLRRGFILRPLRPYAMPGHLRVTMGTPDQMNRLLAVLEEELGRLHSGPAAAAAPA